MWFNQRHIYFLLFRFYIFKAKLEFIIQTKGFADLFEYLIDPAGAASTDFRMSFLAVIIDQGCCLGSVHIQPLLDRLFLVIIPLEQFAAAFVA